MDRAPIISYEQAVCKRAAKEKLDAFEKTVINVQKRVEKNRNSYMRISISMNVAILIKLMKEKTNHQKLVVCNRLTWDTLCLQLLNL